MFVHSTSKSSVSHLYEKLLPSLSTLLPLAGLLSSNLDLAAIALERKELLTINDPSVMVYFTSHAMLHIDLIVIAAKSYLFG